MLTSIKNALSAITASVALLAMPLAQSGCTQLECGDGTIEEDGTCIPADTDPDDAECGEGTELQDGVCVPSDPTICDPGTTIPVEDPDTGIITCQGTGSTEGCDGPINCPAPTSGNVTICGQIFNVEDNAPVRLAGATGAACDLANPTAEGPCALRVSIYDAIEFAGDPSGTDEIDRTLIVDDCGRFSAVSIDRPSSPGGYVGIGIDDHESSGNDDYVLAGVALGTEQNEKIENFQAFAVLASTDQAWSDAAGVDPPFSEQGVYVPIYRYDGDPVENVEVTRGGSAVPADEVYYFEDTDPDTRLDPTADSTATGPNGTALVLMSGLVNHSGIGGDGVPAECEFSSNLAASIETITFVQVKDAFVDGSDDELCP